MTPKEHSLRKNLEDDDKAIRTEIAALVALNMKKPIPSSRDLRTEFVPKAKKIVRAFERIQDCQKRLMDVETALEQTARDIVAP